MHAIVSPALGPCPVEKVPTTMLISFFFWAWKEYMVTHTSDNPSPENVAMWKKLVASYSHTIPEDDKRVNCM